MNTSARLRSPLLAVLVAMPLVGCVEQATVTTSQRTFTILAVEPPKHMHVDLKDNNARIFKHVHVAKRCSNWRQVVLGSTVTLTVTQHTRGADTSETIDAGPICPRD